MRIEGSIKTVVTRGSVYPTFFSVVNNNKMEISFVEGRGGALNKVYKMIPTFWYGNRAGTPSIVMVVTKLKIYGSNPAVTFKNFIVNS